jgi:hypothetical protein
MAAACSTKAATSPADSAPAPVETAAAAASPSAPPSAAAAPVLTASAEASAAPSAAPPPVQATADIPVTTGSPVGAPLPSVKVANIGMHIGGGPNDDVTKDPIRRSVEPHFDAFRRCFAQVLPEEAGKGGDFGVDLRIDREGGKARVSHPRTALKGKEFKECVVRAFEAIEFRKPKGGTTTVSYSLRFTPGKQGS